MKRLSFLIKPASSLCNLQCKYCFYNDVSEHRMIKSSGIMKEDIMKTLIDKSLEALDHDGQVTYAFQGGEPTVAGLNFFKAFVAYVQAKVKPDQKIQYALQTNGYIIDEEWADFFHEHHFLIGVSWDGYKENHDFFRLSANDAGTFKRVLNTVEILKNKKVEFNILTVLSKQLAKHPEKLYKFYQKHDIDYIQLIPCLAGFDEAEARFALTPELFSSFYKRFFALWANEWQNGHYRSIGLFDNLLLMLRDMAPITCGLLGYCSLQLVVESDGSVYPCDFYVLDEYKGGNIVDDELSEIMNSTRMLAFLQEPRKLTATCHNCRFLRICHGNCKRMHDVYVHDNYCGYQDFLSYALPKLQIIVQTMR